MPTRHFLRNRNADFTDEDREVLGGAISRVQAFPAGQVVVLQGVPVNVSMLLVEGFMTRHVDAVDGRHNLVALHVPGEFVDLHAYVLKRLDHDVTALTDIRVAIFTHTALDRLQETHRHLARRLWFSTMLDAALHRQWMFRLASLNATERVAHFLCEMNARLMALNASDGQTFTLPMTQGEIGEVCGLTNVHVSRVLRELRDLGFCKFRAMQVQVTDLIGLTRKASFDPGYLYLEPRVAARAAAKTGV